MLITFTDHVNRQQDRLEISMSLAGAIEKPVDLNLIPVMVNHGCMGLPQELVCYIMEILRDDLQALKASSLTYKAMFVSSRQLIHQILQKRETNSVVMLNFAYYCTWVNVASSNTLNRPTSMIPSSSHWTLSYLTPSASNLWTRSTPSSSSSTTLPHGQIT